MWTLLATVIAITHFPSTSSGLCITAFTYGKVTLTATPTIHSVLDIDQHSKCATACARMCGVGCSAYHVVQSKCYLYSGFIQGIDVTGQDDQGTDSNTVYRLQSARAPECTQHSGFRVFSGHRRVYCFAPSVTLARYDDAQAKCASQGGSLAFVESPDKLTSMLASYDEHTGSYESYNQRLWLGAKFHVDKNAWLGEAEGQVLNVTRYPWNWKPGKPLYPAATFCFTVNRDREITYRLCNERCLFICEMIIHYC